MIKKKINDNDYLFQCPKCGELAHIDKDQAKGKVSIICSNCNYHDTEDWLQSFDYECECSGHKKTINPNDCICSPHDAQDLSACKQND